MADNNFELNAAKNAEPAPHTTGDAFRREIELLRDGIGQGVKSRLLESNPLELAATGAVAYLGASGLKMAMDAGGRWGTAAKVLAAGFTVLGVADLTRRAIPTADAMIDTWKSGRNMDMNKLTVANNLGTAFVDYPIMAASGYLGYRFAPRLSNSQNVDLRVFSESAKTASLQKWEANPLKIPESGVSGKTPDFSIPKNFPELKMPKFDPLTFKNLTTEFRYADIRAARPFPNFPVVPVDLLDKQEIIRVTKDANLPQEDAGKNAEFQGLHKWFLEDLQKNIHRLEQERRIERK